MGKVILAGLTRFAKRVRETRLLKLLREKAKIGREKNRNSPATGLGEKWREQKEHLHLSEEALLRHLNEAGHQIVRGGQAVHRLEKATLKLSIWLSRFFLSLASGLFTGFVIAGVALMVLTPLSRLPEKNLETWLETVFNRNQTRIVLDIERSEVLVNPLVLEALFYGVSFDFTKSGRLVLPALTARIEPFSLFSSRRDFLTLIADGPEFVLNIATEGALQIETRSRVFPEEKSDEEKAPRLSQYDIWENFSPGAAGLFFLPHIDIRNARFTVYDSLSGRRFPTVSSDFNINASGKGVVWEGVLRTDDPQTGVFTLDGAYEADRGRVLQEIAFEAFSPRRIETLIRGKLAPELYLSPDFQLSGKMTMQSSERGEKHKFTASLERENQQGLVISLEGGAVRDIRTGKNITLDVRAERVKSDWVDNFYRNAILARYADLPLPESRFIASGEFNLQTDEQGSLKQWRFDGDLKDFELEQEDFTSDGWLFKTIDIAAFHNRESREGRLQLNNALPVGSAPTVGQAVVSWQESAQTLAVKVEAGAKDLPAPGLALFWPLPAKPEIRAWVMDNLIAPSPQGVFTEGNVRANIFFERKEGKWQFRPDLLTYEGDYAGEQLGLKYLSFLPPATDLAARAQFNQKKTDFTLFRARQGGIKLRKGGITIRKATPLVAGLLQGQATSSFSMTLDLEGSGAEKRALAAQIFPQYIPDFLEGVEADAETIFSLAFPLAKKIRPEWVDYQLHARITNLRDRRFFIDAGNLDLNLDERRLSLKGRVGFAGSPIEVDYLYHLAEGKDDIRAEAFFEGEIDAGLMEKKMAFLPALTQGSVRGEMMLKGRFIQFLDGRKNVKARLDLTPTGFGLAPLLITKKPGLEASVEINGRGDSEKGLTWLMNIKAGREITRASLETAPGGTIRAASFPKTVWADNWLEMGYDGRQKLLSLEGKKLDLGPVLAHLISTRKRPQKKEERNPPLPDILFFVHYEEIRLGRKFLLKNTDMSWRHDRANETNFLNFSSFPGVEQTVNIAFLSGKKQSHLNATITDFGRFLSESTYTDDVAGGVFSLSATRTSPEKPYRGNFVLRDAVIEDAPVFLHIFSSLALFLGSPDIFSGGFLVRSGEAFWEYGDGEIKIENLQIGNTSQRLGLHGFIDLDEERIDIRGQYVPFLPVTLIVENIPLLGPFLSGDRTGGLFGINYSVVGDIDNPKTRVQPLSILTPGIVKLITRDARERKREAEKIRRARREKPPT